MAGRRGKLGWPLVLVALFIAFFFGYPLVMLIYGAFRSGQPGADGSFTLDGFVNAYGDPATWQTLYNSVLYALGALVIGLVIGFILAWLSTRTNMPGRQIIPVIMLVVFAIPSLFFAIAWGMLTSPTGLLTQWFGMSADGKPNFDAYSWAGLILVSGFKSVSLFYLLLIGPVRALNRSMEEAARLSGASQRRLFTDVNLPILLPTISGLVILAFVNLLGQLDVALILGVPVDIYVFPTQIYNYLATTPIRYDSASALALLLIAIIYFLVFVRSKAVGKRSYVTVTGKAYRIERDDIGAWKWAGLAFTVVYALIALVLPLAQLVIGSLQPVLGVVGVTFRHYEQLFTNSAVLEALQTTFVVGIVGGFAATVIAVVITYIGLRYKSWLAKMPEQIIWAVIAVPGIVLALAITWAYLTVPGLKALYGSIWIVLIALVIVVTPIAQRATSGPVGQIGVELEEAARTSGAGPIRTVVTVVIPLIRPTFFASWFVTGIIAAGNLDVPILLSSVRTQTVSLLVYNDYTQLGNGSRAAALLLVLLMSLALLGALLFGASALWRRLRQQRGRQPLTPSAASTQSSHPEPASLAGESR